MSYFDDASLVMIPSGYKTSKVYSVKPTDGSGDLTFSRSNDTATRVNSAGLIEKVRTNVIPYSQAFDNALWIKDSNGTGVAPSVTANNATAPDGTLTADTIVFNAGAGTTTGDSSVIYQAITLTGSATASFYARVTSGTGQLVFRSVGGSTYTTANLTTTWQRFSAAENGASGFFEIGIRRGLANEPINASVTVQMWGAQLEAGDIATDYIATTSAAVSVGPVANVPRLDYLNSSCPRLLLEPQRTNLIQYSEQFNNAWWSPSNSSISANAVTSPDGYTNADNLVENTANSTHGVGNVSGLTLTAASYTFSVFVKKQNRNFFAISTYDGSSTLEGYFNINTGAVATMPAGLTGAITSYGNGWYRCSVTRTMGANANNYFSFNAAATDGGSTYTGTGVVACSIYGGSLELGAYATSYIPTLGAAVTRGADACSKTGISSLIGQSEGVVFVDFEVTDPAAFQPINIYNNNKAGNTISTVTVQFNVNAVVAQFFYGNGTFDTITLTGSVYGLNQRLKVAFRYKSGELALYVNGVQVDTDSATYTAIGTKSEIFLGDPTVYFAYKGGFKLYDFMQFPTSLTNAQLAELTTI